METKTLGFDYAPAHFMFVAVHRDGQWNEGHIASYGPILVVPGAQVLHYGGGLIEGLKVQKTHKTRTALFRPRENAHRMYLGAERMALAPVPGNLFMHGVEEVIRHNHDVIPDLGDGTMYLRPHLFGSGGVLGVKRAPECTFVVWANPVGPYFRGGFKPISLMVSEDCSRVAPGGLGDVKAAGNYSVGLIYAEYAKEHGFDELLYLDSDQRHYYPEEAGTANLFCAKDGVIYTPPLNGRILPGVTRDSVIQLARHLGYRVVEERFTLAFLLLHADEVWCTGTAAVLAEVGRIGYKGRTSLYAPGTIAPRLRKALINLQTEADEDPFEWVHPVAL